MKGQKTTWERHMSREWRNKQTKRKQIILIISFHPLLTLAKCTPEKYITYLFKLSAHKTPSWTAALQLDLRLQETTNAMTNAAAGVPQNDLQLCTTHKPQKQATLVAHTHTRWVRLTTTCLTLLLLETTQLFYYQATTKRLSVTFYSTNGRQFGNSGKGSLVK